MTTTRQYDYVNRLISISSLPSSSSPIAFTYQYNNANQRTRARLADGSYWLYRYDALGQVISGCKYWADGTPVVGQQFNYTFDTIGNRTSTKAGGDQNGLNLRPASYTANRLNQYISRDVPGAVDVMGNALGTATVTVNNQSPYRKVEYFRKELTVDNSSVPVWQSVTVTATGENTVNGNTFVPKTPEQFGYDLDGNLTSDGRWTYTWDAENRLTTLVAGTSAGPQQSIRFDYDAQGRRIRKRVWNNLTFNDPPAMDQRFIYDGWNLVAELAASGSLIRSYVWGLDLSGSMQGAGGVGGLLNVTYYGTQTTNCFTAYDGNGNLATLVDAADGKTVCQYEYGPFGEVIRSTGPMAKVNPFRFSTVYQDDESDLLMYIHRPYSASQGRFLSRDPLGEAGDYSIQRQWLATHQIQSFRGISRSAQPYVFTDNKSVNRFDVLGLFGDGGGGPGTDDSGHADFDNLSKCRFDYTAEDHGLGTMPVPIVGNPALHFQNLPDSESELDKAVNSCDSHGFQSAMHHAQDYYSHYNKNYRWDPGNTALPCNGWGHWYWGNPNDPRCGDAPDHDAAAWNAANGLTSKWLGSWRNNCCLRCKAHWWQRTCKWIKRSSGACATDSP